MLSYVVGQTVVLLVLEGAWIMGTVLRDTISFGNWIIRTVPMILFATQNTATTPARRKQSIRDEKTGVRKVQIMARPKIIAKV